MEGKLLTKSACDSLLVRFSSIMYATFLVILGCILHVSELRQKSKNSTDHIYTIVVALVGIMWLMFLQTDLQRYKRYASKYIFVESLYRDQSLQKDKIYQNNRRKNSSATTLATVDPQTGILHPSNNGVDPSAHSTTSSTASLVNDHLSLNTEVIFKKTAYKMYQQRAAMDRMNSSPRALPANHHQPHHRYYHRNKLLATDNSHPPLRMPASPSSSSNSSSGSLAALDRSHRKSRENLIPAYKFLHGKMGANFYLKCGMAAFCFGHVIHEGLRFGQQLYFFGTGNQNCRDSAALIAHLITPLYSFYQLFMMFKYSNVSGRHLRSTPWPQF